MALVLFDLSGTLLDPGEQAPRLQKAVQLAMAHTLAGDFRPFAELLQAAGGALPDAMPAFPDVGATLDRLEYDGHRLAVVTNSARQTGEQQLAAIGLSGNFERVVGTDEVGAYKPSRKVYDYALSCLGTMAHDAWLVAAHDWDIVGAHAAGLRTAYIDRGGTAPSTVIPESTVTALSELVI